MATISENPHIGRSFNVVHAGLRKLPSGEHIILYFIEKDSIDIVRVLHGSMDVEEQISGSFTG